MAELGSMLLQAIERVPGASQSLDTLDEIPPSVQNAGDREILAYAMGIILMLKSMTLSPIGNELLDKFIVTTVGRIYNLGMLRGQKPTDWRKILLTGDDNDQERPEPDCGA